VVPFRFAPATKVHPDALQSVPLLPILAMSTIITSPDTTPVGLLIIRDVPVVVPVVAVPRCAIWAATTLGLEAATSVRISVSAPSNAA
jgi:hypothetical protein